MHISAVESAGLSTLNEGATGDYLIISNRGKESAGNQRSANNSLYAPPLRRGFCFNVHVV